MGHKIGVTEHSLAGLETCMSDIPRDLFELSFVYECLSTVPSYSSRNLICSAMNLILSFLVIGKQWSTLGDRHIHTTYPSAVMNYECTGMKLDLFF